MSDTARLKDTLHRALVMRFDNDNPGGAYGLLYAATAMFDQAPDDVALEVFGFAEGLLTGLVSRDDAAAIPLLQTFQTATDKRSTLHALFAGDGQ